jgi:DNA-binding winged helix-turn-helix (wHTH) protein
VKPKAFGILRYLVDHAGCLATQEELLDAIWPNTYVQPEVLKRHIADIREVLGDDPRNPAFIETRPWRGYQFIAAVRTTSVRVATGVSSLTKAADLMKAPEREAPDSDPAFDDSAMPLRNVVFTDESDAGSPMFIIAATNRTNQRLTPQNLIAGDEDTSRDSGIPFAERNNYDMKRIDLRREIEKLIQERRSIDRAIADFERLVASLPVRSELPEPGISEKSAPLYNVKRKPRPQDPKRQTITSISSAAL